MYQKDKIYVAGHQGLVGSALLRKLRDLGFTNIVTRSFKELDLRRQNLVEQFFKEEKPDYVFLAAARVGGILENNTKRAEFIYDNLMIQANIIHAAYQSKVKKLLFLGSSCIYPKFSPQPIKEDYLLTGKLEPTNEPYAIAKIAGISLCKSYNEQYQTNFITCMPTNLYGPRDNFDIESSHVIPGIIAKMYNAQLMQEPKVHLWGTGKPFREFLFADDLADALVFLMNNYNGNNPINIGTGSDISIKELAEIIKKIMDYRGNIIWNSTKPDGTPKKLLDITKITELGWHSKTSLEEGIKKTYDWYLTHYINIKNQRILQEKCEIK